MKLITEAFGPAVTNTYLIIDESTKYAVVVDVPPDSAEFLLEQIENYNADLKEIWLTHTHWDHTVDISKIKEKTGAEVLVHKDGEDVLKNPGRYWGMSLPFSIPPVYPEKNIKEGDELIVGHLKFKVLESPGHSKDGVIFVNEENELAITGDTIFKGSIGRTDLPGGDFDILMNSIKDKVLTLPDNYSLYSGHGPKTTVSREKQRNPFIIKYLRQNGSDS